MPAAVRCSSRVGLGAGRRRRLCRGWKRGPPHTARSGRLGAKPDPPSPPAAAVTIKADPRVEAFYRVVQSGRAWSDCLDEWGRLQKLHPMWPKANGLFSKQPGLVEGGDGRIHGLGWVSWAEEHHRQTKARLERETAARGRSAGAGSGINSVPSGVSVPSGSGGGSLKGAAASGFGFGGGAFAAARAGGGGFGGGGGGGGGGGFGGGGGPRRAVSAARLGGGPVGRGLGVAVLAQSEPVSVGVKRKRG
jgi:hypothetical protein